MRFRFGLAAALVILLALVGYGLSSSIAGQPVGQPAPGRRNVFEFLFGEYERPFLLLQALFAAAAAVCLPFARGARTDIPGDSGDLLRPLVTVAVGVLLVTWLGSSLVLHGLPLSMDEFNAVFQAEIFATGRLVAPVPLEWREAVPAIKPTFVSYRAEDGVWLSGYLPVYPAIRAAFLKAGADALVNPLLACASVFLLAAVAKRLWPEDRTRTVLALVLLVTSSQFLFTSMGWYSMPAHLLVNLGWLLLYMRGDRWGLAIVPWVGVLALGLHNPFPHALFAAPFLLRLLVSGRHRWFAYCLGVYGIGSLLWLAWWRFALPTLDGGMAAGLFGIPTLARMVTQAMSLSLVLTWQAPAFGLGLVAALLAWRHLGRVERDLAAGFLLTCVFYGFYSESQGHGWGYRYIHPVLGGAVLLAGRGLHELAEVLGDRRLRLLVTVSALLFLLIQLPLRVREVEGFVRPWARAIGYLSSLDAPVVATPVNGVWYGPDLVRNDPFLGAPVIVSVPEGMTEPARQERLEGHFGGRVRYVGLDELTAFGLRTRLTESNSAR